MPFYDFLSPIRGGWIALAIVLVILALGYVAAPLWVWTLATAIVLYGTGAPVWLWGVFGALALLLNVPAIRRVVLSGPLMWMLKASGFMPTISETEQAAIDSGDVWVDGELFSGRPNFARLMDGATEVKCSEFADEIIKHL